MATVSHTLTPYETGPRATLVVWTPLTSTNVDGNAYETPVFVDKSVQVLGTFGGATVTIQGANVFSPTASDWDTLHKVDNTNLTFTAAGIFTVLDNVVAIRPLLSGGDGTTSITVRLLAASSARK
jgi:hypothetical protein